jgi:glycosyltransferase involved in cell wall biosynthesis
MPKTTIWTTPQPTGLVLRTWTPPAEVAPIVGCVVLRASDLPLLLERMPSWAPGVDRTIVVLGAWSQRETPSLLAATRDHLRAAWQGPLDVILPPKQGWHNQVEKRSAYFRACRVGEVAFVVDADEEVVEGPQPLRLAAAAAFDVGWITATTPLRYTRPFGCPKFFRVPAPGLHYQDRHYWVFAGDRLMAAHAYGGTGWLHTRLPLTVINRGGRHGPSHLRQTHREAHHGDSRLDENQGRVESLRIVQMMNYDAGLVAYRLHSAINATTRDRSVMVSDQGGSNNLLVGPWQYDLRDKEVVRPIVQVADVVHCHVNYRPISAIGGLRPGQLIVIHHHGTTYRTAPEVWDKNDVRACLRLGSTMDVLNHDKTKTIQWLPNPVPIALYRRMAADAHAARRDQEVWIAHSPSKPRIKGTEILLAAVEKLRAMHLPVRLKMTTMVPHTEALWQKAACDLCFDSFWLGIQVSGLEAAAMGMPVVAGDTDTALAYAERLGAVPYTFADETTLATVLEQLITDAAYRQAEVARVGAYVLEYHDEAAVAKRYLELLRPVVEGRLGMRATLNETIHEERRKLATALRGKQQPAKTVILGGHFRLGKKGRGR